MESSQAVIDIEKAEEGDLTYIGDKLRDQVLSYSKTFKTSWINLGQHLFSIYQDEHFKNWGFTKFEDYTEKELGLKKPLCMKLLKTYVFVEQEEPAYISQGYAEARTPNKIPGYEEVNVLRLARSKKDLPNEDFKVLKTAVFEKGKSAGEVRKDLTAIMKEREDLNPEEERDLRNEASIRKMVTALKSFNRDMESLKLISPALVEDAKSLMDKLEQQLP